MDCCLCCLQTEKKEKRIYTNRYLYVGVPYYLFQVDFLISLLLLCVAALGVRTQLAYGGHCSAPVIKGEDKIKTKKVKRQYLLTDGIV